MTTSTVYVVNPRKSRKKATKKKAAKKNSTSRRKKRGHTKMPAKKKAKRRPARRRNTTTRAPARRASPKRRRRNPGSHARKAPSRRRRRSNPSMRSGVNSVISGLKPAFIRVTGAITTAWVVQQVGKKWGDGSLWGDQRVSPMLGESWTWQQYLAAGATAAWGPWLIGHLVGSKNLEEFRRGSIDLIVYKIVWTEGLSRSDWAQRNFGQADVAYDPSAGQMYVGQGGDYAAMQGYMGNLVEASPLDGLVEASPLDGTTHGYGHLLPADVPASLAAHGRYSGSGYTSNYHAAFSR